MRISDWSSDVCSSDLTTDIAAQILLLIQSRGHDWVKEGTVDARWSHSVQSSAAKLVKKLLPLARPQLLVLERDGRKGWSIAARPTALVRLTLSMQERPESLVRCVRAQNPRLV